MAPSASASFPSSGARPSRQSVVARRRAALDRFGALPFTSDEALEAGLSRSDLDSADVRRLFRGVFVDARVQVGHGLHCVAAVRRCGEGARISRLDAALLWGLPVPWSEGVSVSIPASWDVRGAGLVVHRHLRNSKTSSVWVPSVRLRLPTTAPVDLVRECLPRLALVDVVVLADAVLRLPGVEPESARASWSSSGAGPGRARDLVRLVDAGAESAMESRLRVLLVLAGFPQPVAQFEVVACGRRRRLDLAYPDLKIAVEYDGDHHYVTEAQKHADIEREMSLRTEGWEVIRVVSRGIYRDPAGTVKAVAAALERRGRSVRLSDGWRPHFRQLA